MKIYLASSWKNEQALKIIKYELSKHHYVDLFCDPKNRNVFSFDELGDISELNNRNIRSIEKVKIAFEEDKKWLDWSDVCIMVLPCGNSAHLEAGYARGKNKKLVIYAMDDFENGNVDVMYGFADLITDSLEELIKYLANLH